MSINHNNSIDPTLTDGLSKRIDIQVLRGFAVLIVILYHAKFGFLASGYLGVDIFFVISGFLITTAITNGIQNNKFSFLEFYFRRAKRLLPAAYVTFLITIVAAPFFLASAELKEFRSQLIGAVTFTSNIVLWLQSGYFSGSSELKPLLHTWSLSIEEQYYLLFPIFLTFTPKRFWLKGIIILFIGSAALCYIRIGRDSTFYFLPTRAWELMIGSIGALLAKNDSVHIKANFFFWPSLILVLILPFVEISIYHPGIESILICVSTLIVILSRSLIFRKYPKFIVLGSIGDMSYSLYLVHWPLFAFANNVWLGGVNNNLAIEYRLALVILSFVLGYFLYTYIENPIHMKPVVPSWMALSVFTLSSILLIAISAASTYYANGNKDYEYLRRYNRGLASVCDYTNNFDPISECRNSKQPEVLVWGDSFAMHLVPSLLSSNNTDAAIPLVQATRSFCGPLIDIAGQKKGSLYNLDWGKSCIDFNDSVQNYIRNTDSIKIVVLSSMFEQYLDARQYRLVERTADGKYSTTETSQQAAARGLEKAVQKIRAAGKKVVIVGPPPTTGFDIGRCLERAEKNMLTFGVLNQCQIELNEYRNVLKPTLELLNAVSEKADVDVIMFDEFICQDNLCQTSINGTFIYRDAGHLSNEGALWIGKNTAFIQAVKTRAR